MLMEHVKVALASEFAPLSKMITTFGLPDCCVRPV
jgi:hypothetical protein